MGTTPSPPSQDPTVATHQGLTTVRTQKQKVESEGMGKSVHKKSSGREWGEHTYIRQNPVLNCLKCHIPTTSESNLYQNPMAIPPTEIGKTKTKTKNSFIAH